MEGLKAVVILPSILALPRKKLNESVEHMPLTKVGKLWRSDWYLSFLLCLLLLIVFVLYPLSDRGFLARVVLQAFFLLILISGIGLVAKSRTVATLAAIIAVGAIATGWIRLIEPDEQVTVAWVSLWIIFFAVLAWMILIQVFREGSINYYRIQGAVAVYLLLGVIWCGCYRLVTHFDPGAFTMPEPGTEDTVMAKLMYFSFVTLTTVGYGDVTAVHPMARSLALLEALTGQLFPAVLIARLVAMEVSHREAAREEWARSVGPNPGKHGF